MIKNKQKRLSIFAICILIVCSVFACLIMGTTLAAAKLVSTYNSNPANFSTYLAKQEYAVINDTLTSPIPFGYGSHNFDVSIKYSYGYDFDIRIKYSLSWANTKDTNAENVILNFSNRDDYVLDSTYVYYAKTIAAGNGTLPIFTGVDFVDPTDQDYIGGSLTINIDEVKVYKTQTSYTNSHPLYDANSTASSGWLKIMQKADVADATAIVYNYRHNVATGISYPTYDRAYSKTYVTGADPAENIVNLATWLGGNKYYAGLNVYIITGNTPIKLKARARSAWIARDEDEGSTHFENNINLNYDSGWTKTTEVEGNFASYNYNYEIPAHSHVYIKILENVEITTQNYRAADDLDYLGYKLVNVLQINNFVCGRNFITSANINTETVAGTTAYKTSNITITNPSSWQNGLYKTTIEGGLQTFYTNISLTNNTNANINANIAYKLKYYISNGRTAVTSIVGETPSFYSSNLWYQESAELGAEYVSSTLPSSVFLPANTTVSIVNQYSVAATLSSYIANKYNGDTIPSYYDVWVELLPTVTEGVGTSTASLSVEMSATDGKIKLSLKNNSTGSISSPSISNLRISSYSPDYRQVSTEPNNWASNFWEYFMLDNGQYVRYSSATSDGGTSFNVNNCYHLTYIENQLALNYTLLNNFTQTGTTLSAAITLRPGEKVDFAEIENSASYMILSPVATLSGTLNEGAYADIINENQTNAFVYNSTENNYLLRVKGGQLSSNFVSLSDGYSYYVGVLYHGQIVKTQNAQLAEFIQLDGEEFVASSVADWGSEASEFYTNLFNNK